MNIANIVEALNGVDNNKIMTPYTTKRLIMKLINEALAPQGNLPAGGATNQVLAKDSNTDYDTVWKDESYTYTQGVASTSWAITHNLGKYPNVTVVDSGGDEVVGEVTYQSLNELTITFASALSGSAYLS